MNFSLTLFLLLTLKAPTKPITHVPGLINLPRQVNHLRTALSPFQRKKEKENPALECEENTAEAVEKGSQALVLCDSKLLR